MTNNFTFLYVEDDLQAQNWMRDILEDDVKDFFQASNGIEGFEIYKREKPDIILTDINMPIMDGLTMAKAIKEVDATQPVLMLSAFDDKKTLLHAINNGVDGFIPKPIDMDLLFKQLDQIATRLKTKRSKDALKAQKIQNLHNLAYYDSLTQLPNRFFFHLRLDEAIEKAQKENRSLTLFFIDLDGFKNINDTYGHAAGDLILSSVAKNVQEVIRQDDTFSRISGDEFSLILENVEDEQIINKFADKILNAVAKKVDFHAKEIGVTCSIGISQYPKDTTSKEELLHLADSAMYKAKKAGKSGYFYSNKKGLKND